MISLNLMFQESQFNPGAEPCYGRFLLDTDLELERILSAMSRGDSVIESVCTAALFTPLTEMDQLEFRRQNLIDARKNVAAVRRLYDITISPAVQKRRGWQPYSNMAIITIYKQALEIIIEYTDILNTLRSVAANDASGFKSVGFGGLYSRLTTEINAGFLAELRKQISDLSGTDKLLVSAELGDMLESVNYTSLNNKEKNSWLNRRLAPTYKVNMSHGNMTLDEELADINNRREIVLRDTANTLCMALKYLEGFFNTLRIELAFYIGCLNLEDTLSNIGMPLCIPDLEPPRSRKRSWKGMYDIALTLFTNSKVVGNNLTASDVNLYLITGANQGGKSTFLRSIGQAQLMAQCGMPVAADSAVVPLRRGLFTHFKREEDRNMNSGKLDEELARLSEAVEFMESDSMLLLNESFSSTNEREGSEICRQITSSLLHSGVEIFSVSHLYEYAAAFNETDGVQFLRAQRKDDGSRTFTIEPGLPLETAFGTDLYDRIIG